MSNAPTDPQASALARLWRPTATALAALALAAALAACSGGDDEAPEATPTATPVAATPTATATATPTPTPTPAPPTATATPTPAGDAAPSGGGDLLPPELMQLLLDAMSDSRLRAVLGLDRCAAAGGASAARGDRRGFCCWAS